MAGKNTQGKNTQAKGNSNVHIESENSKTNDERLSVQHIHCLHKTKTKFYQNIKYLSICISEKKKNAHVEKDELTILNTGHNWHQHVSRGIA